MVREDSAEKILDADFSGNERVATLARLIQEGIKYGKQQQGANSNQRGQTAQAQGSSISSFNIQFYDGGGTAENTSGGKEAGLRNSLDRGVEEEDSGVEEHRSDTGEPADASGDKGAGVNAGRMTRSEFVTKALLEVSKQNKDDVSARINAMKSLGDQLATNCVNLTRCLINS